MAKTDIVKLISSYIPLKKKGNTHWGCCPFHNEKTPSFAVNEQKQFFHCFGCGAAGNAITFVKKIESAESGDAIKILAAAAGMEPPKIGIKQNSDENAQKRERLYALMREAAKHYHKNLVSGASSEAKEYLQKRGITDNLITKFGLGYSLKNSDIIPHLKSLGYTDAEIKEAGLSEVNANGSYDVFYDRLIFPIINNFKEVVAFGGRTLKHNAEFAKYRNSSQTIIFDKSRNVYGINLLKARKLRGPIEYIIMAEGYMDVIALHKAGFDTAVASMGTALTFAQAKMLKNYCNKIYISYDGDSAGQKATMRGLDILQSADLNVKVVSLPDGLDPDDVIKQHGKEFYENLLKSALTLTAFKIETLKKQYDLSLPDEKSKFAVEAVRAVKQLKNPVEQEEYLKLIHVYTGYTMAALHSQADITPLAEDANEISPAIQKQSQPAPQNPKLQKSAQFILAAIVNKQPYAEASEDFAELMPQGFYETLARHLQKNKDANLNSLFDRVDEEHLPLLTELIDYEFIEGDGKEKFDACIKTLRADKLTKERDRLIKKYDAGGDDKKNIMAKITELNEEIRELN